ncbi:MAG: TonB-dependent receptor [Sideroxyarcus sp.]|nr:TonB-dependent receptor [Sideroxyarcus sp.]
MLRRRPTYLHVAIVRALQSLAVTTSCGMLLEAYAADATLPLVTVSASTQREAQIERKNAGLQKIVISEEEVERYGDATVGDVLRRLPGMSFTGPAGVAKDIRMRGLDKGYTQILINGEPVPGAAQERQMQVDRLPADMIERIEVIRNPTAEYDAGGIGGTINIVLKSRAEDLTRLRVAYGKNGKLDVGDVIAQWSRHFDQLDVVLALSHTVGAEDVLEDKNTLNASGSVTAREHKAKPVKKAETLFSPRLTWAFGEDRLTFEPLVSLGTEDKRETSDVRNATGVLTKGLSNAEDKSDQIARLAARYDGKTNWGSWSAKLGIAQGKSDKDKYATEAKGSGVLSKRSQEFEHIREDQQYLGAGVALPLGAHLVKAGIERRDVDYEKRKNALEANNAQTPLKAKAPGANDIYTIKEAKAVAYLQDEWQIAGAQWLTPGMRYERNERDASDRNGATRSATQASPNPSLHYRWAIANNSNLRASVARTLKLPKFDDVNPLVTLASGAGAGTITNPDKGGNANLQPERATGIELGVEQFIAGNHGVLGFNVYNRELKAYIQKATRQEGARLVERPTNAGDARFWGAELDWRVPLLHKGAHELTLTGSHAELRGEVSNAKTGGKDDVKDLPPRVSNLGLDWRHAPSQWSAGFAVNYAPAFGTDSLNADGVRELKRRNAATLLDLYITKVFSPQAELRLIAKTVLALQKQEATTKYNANGSFNSAEAKVESSKPTVFVTFESRF